MHRRHVIAWGCVVPLFATPGRVAWAQPATLARRKALVIGNARYAELPLDNPENDARLIAQTLQELGFEVTFHLNLKVRDFRRALREFARNVQDDDAATVFYYAGHGMQINGRNYLLPVDLNLRDADEVRDESVDLEDVLGRSERPGRQARIFIIDACRDNPFGVVSTRPERARKGLAVTGASGALIAFSAGPGSTSEDGPAGGNSVYSARLAAAMREPGLPIESVLKRVAVQVREDTRDRQVPWVNTSLQVDFQFNPGQLTPDTVARAPPREAAPAAAARRIQVQVLADRQLNTDTRQQSATLALRLYLLRDGTSFQRASFDALYDHDEQTLGSALLVREIVHLRPGDSRDLSLGLLPGTQVIGVFAAFRELGQSQWRAVLRLPGDDTPAPPSVQVGAQARSVQIAWGR
jgi:type VI secretion system VasD/TssJ family lipoprotein